MKPHRGNWGKFVVLAIFPGLVACAHQAVTDRIVVEKVPVAVQPIKAEQVPKAPAPLPKRPESLSSAADLLLADHCQWVAFGITVMPLLQVSAGVPITPLPRYPECEGRN